MFALDIKPLYVYVLYLSFFSFAMCEKSISLTLENRVRENVVHPCESRRLPKRRLGA